MKKAQIISKFIERWHLFEISVNDINQTSDNKCFQIERIDCKTNLKCLEGIIQHKGGRYLNILKSRQKDDTEYIGYMVKEKGYENAVAIGWIKLSSFYEKKIKRYLELKEGEAFLFDAFCLPEYRGKKIHEMLLIERLNFCKDHEIRKVFTIVSHFNKSSVKNILGFGFKRISSRTYLRQGLIRKIFGAVT